MASGLRSPSVCLYLIFFILAFFASSYCVQSSASLSSAENNTLFALLDFKARITLDPSGSLSSWNTSSHFCTWNGVFCPNGSNQVHALLLHSCRLSGTLSSQIANLQDLSIIDFSQNQFSGSLPSSLGRMKNLEYLCLPQNQLSGPLPITLGQVKTLQYVDLSWNQLSGPLPSSLGQLKSLQYFDLSRNQLSGPLPSSLGQMESLQYLDLSHNQLSGPLPFIPFSLNVFNVSYNRLEGTIPMDVGVYQKLSSASFLGNPGLCAPFLITSCSHDGKRNIKLDVLVAACAVGPVSLVASIYAWWYCYRRKNTGSDFAAPQYKAWTAEEMRAATNDFDAVNVIGSGSVSTCYMGVMKLPAEGMRVVALKRLTVDDYDGEDDEARKSFVNEFKTLGKLRHRNLVKVMGYCVEGAEIALVMEYMEKGDLDSRLHNEANGLSWEERVNVALDVAEGLVYLHHEYEQPIIHCDLKPKNILLRSDMVAKISDFGIARLLDVSERGDMSMSKLRGSFGYIAPEYGMGLRISTKVDVYSYGMMLLELVTKVRPTSSMLVNKAMSLHTWAQTLHASGQITEALGIYNYDTLEEAKQLLRLGVQCTHDVAKERPTMYTVRDFILLLKEQRLKNEPRSNHNINIGDLL